MLTLLTPILALALTGPAQMPVKTIQGIVRAVGDSGAPLVGATVQIGKRTATSNADGSFRVDSVPYGFQQVVIRRIGFQGSRSVMSVFAGSQDFWEFFLSQSPFRLEEEVVEGRRTGLYGVVTDRFQKPLAGAKVEAIGNGGSTQTTDSAGRFAFPSAIVGGYLVRTSLKGYVERRLMLEVERGKGVELSIALTPGEWRKVSHADAAALFDLRRSLAFGLRRERMVGEELTRYGSLSVCDVPRVRNALGTRELGILNGERVMPPGEICSWNADEVAMIQFITGSSRRTARGSARGATTVVIWEKW
jgi:carboxypeptidase family protein